MARRCVWLGLALGAALVGCSGGEEASPRPASSVVLYGPRAETELTLYPSDRYTATDPATRTGRRVEITPETTADELIERYPVAAEELSAMDGFSPTGGVFVRLSAPIDPRGLVELPDADPPVLGPVRDANDYAGADSPLLLVDVDPSSPEQGSVVGLVPTYYAQAKDDYYTTDEYTLLATPAVPLASHRRYALVVTDRLLAADGTPVGRSPDMHELLERPSDDYGRELRDALELVSESTGVSRRHVVGATVFTTASVEDGVVAMAKQHRAAAPPAETAPWSIETPRTAPDTRVRFRATYAAPEYRKPRAPGESLAFAHGKWTLGADGAPIAEKTVDLEAFLAFSDATRSGPRPVVIYQHGLGGDKDGCWGTTQRLAGVGPDGVAVFAIDSPEHGSRAKGETNVINSVYGFFGIDAESNDFDIERARDNFRQMASDQLELVRFIRSLASLDLLPLDPSGNPDPDGVPDLDVSRIFYIGHSFGSVQAATLLAVAPEVTAATLNVGGAGLMMLLRDSNTFNLVVKGFVPPGTPYGAVARFMAATQAIVDPGDPLNFARYMAGEPLDGVAEWTPRDVLLQEVHADSIVPNSTTEALARAFGMQLEHEVHPISGMSVASAPLTGNGPNGATMVVSQFDRIEGGKLATHGELIFSPEANAQYVGFFRSALGAAHATVGPAYP
ncbi:MAG: alpha/beta fold hydrolase [Sorangiineae bacterium]|nr:alpha/beta fold hydrolase [Polyangiaceae bacterium]MEB2321210.1 alpha/beta fold hydrolase [Sorangiineae bacterium]